MLKIRGCFLPDEFESRFVGIWKDQLLLKKKVTGGRAFALTLFDDFRIRDYKTNHRTIAKPGGHITIVGSLDYVESLVSFDSFLLPSLSSYNN